MDILNFSSSGSGIQKNGGTISINMSADDPNAALLGNGANNNGINTTVAGGINYNDMIGKKTDLRSNYFFSSFNPLVEKQISREYLLPDSSYFYDQGSRTDNISNTHRVNFSVEHRFDSMTSLKISPSFGIQSTDNNSSSVYNTLSGSKSLTNDGITNTYSNSSGYNARNELLFRKKFNNRGRTFSFNLTNTLNRSDGYGSQYSLNRFFNPDGSINMKDSINQKNIFSAALNSYSAKAIYTEPLSKRLLMELNAGKSNSRSESNRETYDFNNANGKYDELNNILSNDFSSDYEYSDIGTKVRYQKRNITWQQGRSGRRHH